MTHYVVDYEIMNADVGLIFEKRTYITVKSGDDALTTISQELHKEETRVRITRYEIDTEEDDTPYAYDFFC